jgi:ribonuclease P/MRP protein subunit RPP1
VSFYFVGAAALPEGSDSASRLALAARDLGYSGIIICNCEPGRIFRWHAAEQIKGIDVQCGAEVEVANARALRSCLSAWRAAYPFLAVEASSEEISNAACESPNVDALLLSADGRLSIAAARAARQSQVAIGFDLSPLFRLRGSPRARWLEAVGRNLALARKFDLSMILACRARSSLDLRGPREILAMAEIAGFEPAEAEEAMLLPERILRENKKRWLGPGVVLH